MDENTETIAPSCGERRLEEKNDAPAVFTPFTIASPHAIATQAACATCGAPGGASDPNAIGAGMMSYVYAVVGRVEARFPSLAAEKEFAQATDARTRRPSSLSSTRNIVDVISSYTDRHTDFTEKFLCGAT
jgi:hypothetical protein